MSEPNFLSSEYQQGYLDGFKAKSLYAHARLHKVLNYVQDEMKEILKEEDNQTNGGK